MIIRLVLAGAVVVGALVPAAAQTDPGAQPAPRAGRGAARPAQSITVTNASSMTATTVVVTAEDQTAQLTRPLAPKARATLRLPKLKGCLVSVAATFEGEAQADLGEFDVCKDRTIRFTD